MSRFEVTFTVPVEVVVTLDVHDSGDPDNPPEDTAADAAWPLAEDYLSSAAVADGRGVAIHGSIDGIAADKVREVE